MIGWYCNAGYILNSATPNNLSDITWTDEHRPFTIPIFSTIPEPGITYYEGDSAQSAYSALYGFIKEDINTLYPLFGPDSSLKTGDRAKRLIGAFPSITLAYPNLYSTLSSSDGYGCFYIPTLKRLIIVSFENSSAPSYLMVLCKVTDDGNVSSISGTTVPALSTLSPLSFCYSNFWSFMVNGLKVYDSTIDIGDIENYVNIKLTCNWVYNVVTSPTPSALHYNICKTFYRELFAVTQKPDFTVIQPDNPYEPVDPSGPSDGQGTFDDSSDQIPDSTKPTLSSANTGFTRIYNPSLAQVQDLARYLWTDTTIIDTIWNHIRQYFEDPMQAIIGFNLVPVPVPDGGTEEFKLMFFGTGVQMTVAASQFVDVDCGTLSVPEYYGSALDYTPYTKISAFLPFIGNVDLNPDEIMGRTIQVKYRVDICSGSCVAKILVDGNVLYQYSGHCAIPIPISAADFSSYVSAAVSVAKLAIGAAVGGAMGAAAVGGTEALQATGNMQQTRIINTERNPATGRQITSSTQTIISQRPQSTHQTEASFGGITPANITNTVGEIMGSKPFFQHSGSFSGNTGYLGVRRPYLIIIRPRLCIPSDYQKMNGYPCMMTLKLGDCSGYTRVQQVQLTGMTATNPEQSEILQLLKMGVII